jgi:hypothetical protein
MGRRPEGLLRGIARAFELDTLSAGERRSWTVRLEHGVHLVRLDQSPLGNRLFLDGREVARSGPWTYEDPLRFRVGGQPAEVRFSADERSGSLRTQLLVAGEPVRADPPRARERPRPFRWGVAVERACYVVGGALLLGGLTGEPVSAAVRQVLWTAGVLVLSMGLRAVDPFDLLSALLEKSLRDGAPMIVAGGLLIAIAAIARDRFGLRERIPLVREAAVLPRIIGWTALAALALALIALV